MCVCVCVMRYMSSSCSLFLDTRYVLKLGLSPLTRSPHLSPHNTEGQRASAAASATQINETFIWVETIAWWAEGGGCGGVGAEYERQKSKVMALHV